MDALGAAWLWIRANQSDFDTALTKHVEYVLLSLVIGIIICVPLGIAASRNRLVSLSAINAIGTARAIPSIALLFLAVTVPFLGFQFQTALAALTVLACLPILVNTSAGFSGVEPAIVEAARGMGMSAWQVLMRIELPLALPVVMAGIRTAGLEVIASAILATFIGGGGLGDIITQGLSNNQIDVLLAGAIPVALMALCAELLFSGLQRLITPAT
jgi:osmoprotectant transport system permease protein